MSAIQGRVGLSRDRGTPHDRAVLTRLRRAARRHRVALILVVVLATSLATLHDIHAASQVPDSWPAAGLLTGAMLLVGPRRRAAVLCQGLTLVLLAHLLTGYDPVRSIGFTLALALGAWLTVWRMLHRLDRPRPGLLDTGDVSRVVTAVALGSGTSGVGVACVVALHGEGSPWLALAAAIGTHAAALMMLLPFFLEAPGFPPIAPAHERIVLSVTTLVVIGVVFLFTDAPPLMFAVMPMFAWLAFRGTLREASVLLTAVGVVVTWLTMAHLGPAHGLMDHYGMPTELMTGYLQLFLIVCALVLLPLSVMTTQQRRAAARATADHVTMERLVSSATGTAVVSIDTEGRIVGFNPGAQVMLGRSVQQAMGERLDRFFPDEELGRHAARLGVRPIFADICAAAVAAGEDSQLWTFAGRDGGERTMTMTPTEVFGEDGTGVGYLCVAEDVTEQEARNRSLVLALEHERAAVERLRELERVKADFVATVSHELRTPLTSMMGYVEVLEDGVVGELSANQRAVVNRVERNGRRLLLLVEDLLLLSQIEAREMRMNPVVADVREAVHSARDAVSPLLATRHLDFVIRVPDEPVLHEGDPLQVERMLVNLLSNAVKFTPDGGRVELVVSERPEAVSVVVLDTGMGIPEAEQDQLFTRFFRASTASRDAIQGTGLGLTIVQAIIDAHGGDVSISSTEGVGTTVTASLPKVLPRSAEVPAGAPVGASQALAGEAPADPLSA